MWVENSIVQAVPEHPKKDFVFCLSNSVGDAFLFQVRETLVFKTSPARNSARPYKGGTEMLYSNIQLRLKQKK